METNQKEKLTPEMVSEIIAREEAELAEKKRVADLSLPAHEKVSITAEGITVYPLDYDKVNRLEDVMTVLQALDIRFSQKHPFFNNIKHLLKGI